jgi:6-phosphogluconolactonase
MEILRFADLEEISGAATGLFVDVVGEAVGRRGSCSVALAGGSTPRRTYELLAQPGCRERVAWSKVHFFWGDERCVPPDHAESNFRMANEALLRPVQVAAGNIHRIEAERADADRAASEYQRCIADVHGVDPNGPPPALDLVFLGLGPDAHTASLFPHTTALQETHRWVVVNDVPKLATRRLTLTPRILNEAACIAFLVAGADKAAALRHVLQDPGDPLEYPAQLVRPRHGRLLWIVDREAGGWQ